MTRWEYKFFTKTFGSPAVAEAAINELGAQGWELIHVEPSFGVFKRPLMQEQA
jgi:hypothetical protein